MAPARTLRAGAALAVLVAVVAAAAASARTPPLSVIEDDAALLRSGDGMRQRTLDDMAALGADVVRVIVPWRDVPGVWPALDAAVAGARARGLEPLLTLSGPAPLRASGCRPRGPVCRPSPPGFAAFVAEAGARYPDVRLWSLWNEPNVPTWLQPQTAAPTIYRELVRRGVAALASTGHGKDTILIGETAPVHDGTSGPPRLRPTAPLRFARAVLKRATPGTAWAHHAYTGGGVRDPAIRGREELLGPTELGALERVLPRRMRIWITEAGFQTDPPDPFFGVAPAAQAAWINETDWILARRPRVASVAQYLIRDERRLSSFQSGLRYADGRRKPSYNAYRAPLWVRRGKSAVSVWGLVRPRGATLVALERRAPGARRWAVAAKLGGRSVDRRVRVRARGGRWRLRWRDAGGGIHGSRVAREAG